MLRGLTARGLPRCSTKKRWSNVENDGVGMGSGMVILSDGGCEEFEALAHDRHEVRDARQIPIGVGHLGMADIGRERSHRVVDIGPMLMPKLDAAADESVAQVMYAGLRVGAARRPAKFVSQLLEHRMDGPRRQQPVRRRRE